MNQKHIKNGVFQKTTFEKTLTGEILLGMDSSEKESVIKKWLASPVLELEEYILTNYQNRTTA
jgi:hypothetical protein